MKDKRLGDTSRPTLRPFNYLTPSRIFSLEQCALRATFESDRNFQNLAFQGPKARLGSIAHRVLERVVRGELNSVPEPEWKAALEQLWNEEVAEEEKIVLDSPLEAHFGAAPYWPSFAIQKARLFRKALELCRIRQGSNNSRGRGTWVERSYNAFDGKIRGRADLVYNAGDGTHITDYKTGDILEPESEAAGDAATLRAQYRRQVLLYAAMHFKTTGVWPIAGQVVSLTGDSIELRIVPEEAEQEVAAALALLEGYIGRATATKDLAELASPGPAACRFCNYKMRCSPFWKAISLNWDWGASVTLTGLVSQVNSSVTQSWSGTVDLQTGNLETGTYTIRGNRPFELTPGMAITAVNLLRREGDTALLVTDYSQVWLESPSSS